MNPFKTGHRYTVHRSHNIKTCYLWMLWHICVLLWSSLVYFLICLHPAFMTQFSLSISVYWDLTVKNPSHSSTLQPPCHFRNSPRPSFVPPRLAHHHPSIPPGFCSRAMGGPPMGGCPMGGPTALHPHLPYSSPPYSQRQLVPPASPLMRRQLLLSRPPPMTGLLWNGKRWWFWGKLCSRVNFWRLALDVDRCFMYSMFISDWVVTIWQ